MSALTSFYDKSQPKSSILERQQLVHEVAKGVDELARGCAAKFKETGVPYYGVLAATLAAKAKRMLSLSEQYKVGADASASESTTYSLSAGA